MLPDWSTVIRQVKAPAERVTTASRDLKSSLAVTSTVNSPLPTWLVSSSTTHHSLSEVTVQCALSTLSATATVLIWLELVMPRTASHAGVSTTSSLPGYADVPSSDEQAAKTVVAAANIRKMNLFISLVSFYLRLSVWSGHPTFVVMLFVPPSQPFTASK